jgi:hypothetical protein
MYTFLNHGRWNRCSCIYKNDAELFFNVWHQLTKFSETGWPRSACNFMFPLREKTSSLGERREDFRCIAFRLLRRGNMKLHALLGHPVSENFVSWCQTLKNNFKWEELKWLQICEFLIEIIFILFLNTTLLYNFILPVKKYLAINRGVSNLRHFWFNTSFHSLTLLIFFAWFSWKNFLSCFFHQFSLFITFFSYIFQYALYVLFFISVIFLSLENDVIHVHWFWY